MEGRPVRRIAIRNHCLNSTLITICAVLFSLIPAYGAPKKASVIVKVNTVSRVSELAKKYGLKIKKSVNRGIGAAFVVEDLSQGQLKQLLKDEPDFAWVEDNKLVPLDGGETVLPLDGGETVLPLDGGETVLPLGASTDQLIAQLLQTGTSALSVEELNTIRSAYASLARWVTPSQKLLLQPGFRKIGLYPSVLRASGQRVIVADLDTGADTCHEALRGVVTFTFVEGADANAPENCPTNATVPVPGYGHGTAVASMIRMVAPQATIWAMRVFDNTGTAQTSDIYEAIIFAADHGVDVINMSFGTTQPSQALEDAIAYARERGVVMVAAGGNNNTEPLMYPAANPGVKGVIAVTNGDLKTTFSNYGSMTSFSAPGHGLWVAYPNHKLSYVAGTSYASPLVAGEVALIIDAYHRTLSGEPTSFMIDVAMFFGANFIDFLNPPQYLWKLGRGRIYIPWALNTTGLPALPPQTAPLPATTQ
jgi:subtilisin family serine protease